MKSFTTKDTKEKHKGHEGKLVVQSCGHAVMQSLREYRDCKTVRPQDSKTARLLCAISAGSAVKKSREL